MSENNTSQPRLNDQILKYFNDLPKLREVRLIDENGEQKGVMPAIKALDLARSLNLDLIEIAPNAQPPVCKIIDYKKFLYEHRKKQKEIKAKSSKITIKEIRFGPNTDEHDFVFKKNHAQKFLEEGSKVKAFVLFKGRTILFKEKGELMLLRFAQDLAEFGKVEQLPLLEGKKMMMTLAPKPKK